MYDIFLHIEASHVKFLDSCVFFPVCVRGAKCQHCIESFISKCLKLLIDMISFLNAQGDGIQAERIRQKGEESGTNERNKAVLLCLIILEGIKTT